MNEEKPKSFWKKNISGRLALVIWIAVAAFVIIATGLIIGLTDFDRPLYSLFLTGAVVAGISLLLILVLIYIVWPLARWLFWRHWRRTLFGLACFATLIALLYAEENWRGKHDWEKFKREWEAKGEKFDFKDFVPAPVPDDQNFAMAPIWVESMKAQLGGNARKLFGDHYAENGRTNFSNRLALDVWRYDNPQAPANGDWTKGTITDLKSWQDYYRAPIDTNRLSKNRTSEFPISAQPQTPAQDVLLALSKYDLAIEELRAASQLPLSRFPLNYNTENTAAILLPHLATLKRSSWVLQLRALAELQNGQSEKAFDDIKLLLRLVDSIHSEPFLISHLVRIAMVEIVLQPVYEGLANHQWTDAQLAGLDSELAKLDFLVDCQFSLRGTRAMDCGLIDYISKKDSYQRYRMLFNLSWAGESTDTSGQLEKSMKATGICLIPNGWFEQNKLFIAHADQGWITGYVFPEDHLVSPQKYREVDHSQATIFEHSPKPWNFLAREFLSALGALGRKSGREQISVDLARTAIALERYRLAHGNFPDSLDALAPQFIAQVPHDVINGQPLHYRRTSDGQFVLYSVGWNERDDGGVVVFKKGETPAVNVDEGDWVWRYPQK